MINQAYQLFPSLNKKVLHSLLCIVCECNFPEVLTRLNPLTLNEIDELKHLVEKFENGTPLEYLTNKCSFYGMDFFVNENVLIPRVETELLVEKSFEYIASNSQGRKCKILDLCTGSGIVAVSIAKECAKNGIDVEILAIDVCPLALDVCKKNIEMHKVNVNVLRANALMEAIPKGFDVVVSNPPYIETQTIFTLENSVRNFEPHLALDGGADGLVFYKKFASIFQQGALFLEIGYNQAEALRQILPDCVIFQDFNKNDRICKVIFS